MNGLSTQNGEQVVTDALTLLEADHQRVNRLFEKFKGASDEDKENIVAEVCDALTAHMTVEEELLYPEVRHTPGSALELLVDSSYVEHFLVKSLVENLKGMRCGQSGFEAAMKVLMEQVEHHVNEEETLLFPRVRGLDIDLRALGQRISERKAGLLDQA